MVDYIALTKPLLDILSKGIEKLKNRKLNQTLIDLQSVIVSVQRENIRLQGENQKLESRIKELEEQKVTIYTGKLMGKGKARIVQPATVLMRS